MIFFLIYDHDLTGMMAEKWNILFGIPFFSYICVIKELLAFE